MDSAGGFAFSRVYSEEFLKRNNWISGSPTEVVKSSNAYIQHLVETDPDNLLDTLRNDISIEYRSWTARVLFERKPLG